jgi:Domain of unknown function (DUF4440)
MGTDTFVDLVRAWAGAELRGDPEALDTLLASDFVGVGPRGFVLTRDQWLVRYRTGELRNSSFDALTRLGDTQLANGDRDAAATTWHAPLALLTGLGNHGGADAVGHRPAAVASSSEPQAASEVRDGRRPGAEPAVQHAAHSGKGLPPPCGSWRYSRVPDG